MPDILIQGGDAETAADELAAAIRDIFAAEPRRTGGAGAPVQGIRAVLAALDEPEPQLPPFDPAKIEPLDYEPAIRRLLAEHAKKER